jgi:hypothetical protein
MHESARAVYKSASGSIRPVICTYLEVREEAVDERLVTSHADSILPVPEYFMLSL